MKAIIQGKETEYEQRDGQWRPKTGDETDIQVLNDGRLLVKYNNEVFTARLVEVNKQDKKVTLYIGNKKTEVSIKEPLDDLLHAMGLDKLNSQKADDIKAPMPGLVLNILVSPGNQVKKGDKLLVLEAMKMENIIKATGDGTVARILVDKGQAVDKNQKLVIFE